MQLTRESFKKTFTGNISRRAIVLFLMPACAISHFSFLFIAWLLFPANPAYLYDWATSTISRLGWPLENVQGWIFFSLAEISLGIFIIPLIPYYYRRFSPVFKGTSRMATFFFACASIGCILLGLIPNYPALLNIHSINAVLVFAGFNFLGIFSVVMMVADKKMNNDGMSFFKNNRLSILYMVSVLYMATCSIMTVSFAIGGAGEQYVFQPGTPLLQRPPFWEWQAFVAILLSTGLLFAIIPEKIPAKN